MRALPRRAVIASALVACAACAPVDAAVFTPTYHADDRAPSAGFDPNALIDDAVLADVTWDDAAVQRYLERTHYAARSFLAVYHSGDCGESGTWCSAAHAIAVSSQRHAVNARVLLAFAEVEGQLLSAPDYPLPSARVEYAFACGCDVNGCDPAAAGFDVQVECLAAKLAAARDAAASGGATSRGARVGESFTTLDGVTVVPANAATAAVYDVLPDVSVGAGGAWMVSTLTPKIR